MSVYPYSSIYQHHHWHYLSIYKEDAAIYHLHQWLACYFHRKHISVYTFSVSFIRHTAFRRTPLCFWCDRSLCLSGLPSINTILCYENRLITFCYAYFKAFFIWSVKIRPICCFCNNCKINSLNPFTPISSSAL